MIIVTKKERNNTSKTFKLANTKLNNTVSTADANIGLDIYFKRGISLASFQGIIGATDIKDIRSNTLGKLTKS
jgi:hypothetical protein